MRRGMGTEVEDEDALVEQNELSGKKDRACKREARRTGNPDCLALSFFPESSFSRKKSSYSYCTVCASCTTASPGWTSRRRRRTGRSRRRRF